MPIRCPLPLAPIPVPKVWGGSLLRAYVPEDEPQDRAIGEVWLLCDRDDRTSTVTSGAFEGRTLRGLMLSEEDGLLGDVAPARGGTFPLLIKLLDARQNLSVQVHPDARAAKSLGSDEKNECWYVMDADPGAEVLLGLAEGVDAATFARGADTPDIVDLLRRFPVRAGDGIDVPAGTVHSICAGIAIAEVQSNSDTTYRLYDWDREVGGEPRPLHIDHALKSIDYEMQPEAPAPLEYNALEAERGAASVNRSATLRDGRRFHAEVVDVHQPAEMAATGRPTALFVLTGSGRLECGDGNNYGLEPGTTWLLPADLESARIMEADGDLRVLRARPKRVTGREN